MSQPHQSPPIDSSSPPDYAGPVALGGPPKLLRLGGALGMGASFVGLLIFLAACHGLGGAFVLSFIPVLLGMAGFVFCIAGALTEKDRITEDTHVMAALFACCMGIIGGLVEVAVWRGWQLFHG